MAAAASPQAPRLAYTGERGNIFPLNETEASPIIRTVGAGNFVCWEERRSGLVDRRCGRN